MSFWAVAQVRPYLLQVPPDDDTETRAEAVFSAIGFDTYLPKVRTRRRVVPLFPGYIFIRVVDHWHAISRASGVIRLLMTAEEKPAKLPDRIVDGLRDCERKGLVWLKKDLVVGSRVRITAGPFAGHLGLYDGQGPRERERVLLELLGQSVPIQLDRGMFERA